MKKANEQILKALCNLEGNPDFRIIQEWFLESAAEQDTVLRSAESATIVYRAQGASKTLLEFCDLAASPREYAGKMAMKDAGIYGIPS